MSACLLSFAIMVWVPGTEPGYIFVPLSHALVFGGILQAVAGVLELIKGNTFGGTVFCCYGCFWMCLFTLHYLAWRFPEIGSTATAPKGMALFYGLYGVLSCLFLVLTLRKNLCLVATFSTIVIAFSLLAGGEYNANVSKASGYFVGLVGVLGIYTAFASMMKVNGVNLPGIDPIELF